MNYSTCSRYSFNMQKTSFKEFAMVCFGAQDMPNLLNWYPGTTG